MYAIIWAEWSARNTLTFRDRSSPFQLMWDRTLFLASLQVHAVGSFRGTPKIAKTRNLPLISNILELSQVNLEFPNSTYQIFPKTAQLKLMLSDKM